MSTLHRCRGGGKLFLSPSSSSLPSHCSTTATIFLHFLQTHLNRPGHKALGDSIDTPTTTTITTSACPLLLGILGGRGHRDALLDGLVGDLVDELVHGLMRRPLSQAGRSHLDGHARDGASRTILEHIRQDAAAQVGGHGRQTRATTAISRSGLPLGLVKGGHGRHPTRGAAGEGVGDDGLGQRVGAVFQLGHEAGARVISPSPSPSPSYGSAGSGWG